MKIQRGNDLFEAGCELIDVTSMSRPDTSWHDTDVNGHEHQWFTGGAPAQAYSPSALYELPTLRWVVDGTQYYEDGEPYEVGHYECNECGEHVTPRSTADTNTQYIPGLRWCRINGEHVSEEEFKRRYESNG